MASVFDVAAYILQLRGAMTAMKLQKLVYYCQAWHLVRRDAQLFAEEIQAWAAGPVVRSLYARHRGLYTVDEAAVRGDPTQLSDDARKTIERVVEHYGHLTAAQLSDLTHDERPWQEARVGLGPTERGEQTIDPGTMSDFYTSLAQRGRAQ